MLGGDVGVVDVEQPGGPPRTRPDRAGSRRGPAGTATRRTRRAGSGWVRRRARAVRPGTGRDAGRARRRAGRRPRSPAGRRRPWSPGTAAPCRRSRSRRSASRHRRPRRSRPRSPARGPPRRVRVRRRRGWRAACRVHDNRVGAGRRCTGDAPGPRLDGARRVHGRAHRDHRHLHAGGARRRAGCAGLRHRLGHRRLPGGRVRLGPAGRLAVRALGPGPVAARRAGRLRAELAAVWVRLGPAEPGRVPGGAGPVRRVAGAGRDRGWSAWWHPPTASAG